MDIKELEKKLRAHVEYLRTELQSVRGNRPSPRMVEDIKVEYYGQEMPVKALGSISVVPPREIVISVWDKAAVNVVAKGIENSNLKITASVDGNNVRVILPQLTEERKRELEKTIKKMTEEEKIKIRGDRDEINKVIKQMQDSGALSEDAAFRKKEEVQKSVDRANNDIDETLKNKLQDILS